MTKNNSCEHRLDFGTLGVRGTKLPWHLPSREDLLLIQLLFPSIGFGLFSGPIALFSLHFHPFSHILSNRPTWDMYASLRGASSTEDRAVLNRNPSWLSPARASVTSSRSRSKRSLSVPIELPTPLSEAFHAVSIAAGQ